jgi:predicted metal-binding membrane protein
LATTVTWPLVVESLSPSALVWSNAVNVYAYVAALSAKLTAQVRFPLVLRGGCVLHWFDVGVVLITPSCVPLAEKATDWVEAETYAGRRLRS